MKCKLKQSFIALVNIKGKHILVEDYISIFKQLKPEVGTLFMEGSTH